MVPFLRKPDTSVVSSCSCYVDKDISVYFLTVPSCSFKKYNNCDICMQSSVYPKDSLVESAPPRILGLLQLQQPGHLQGLIYCSQYRLWIILYSP